MKHPTLKKCPCCGIEALRIGPMPTVEPVCKNERYDPYGALVDCQLYWLCLSCGCEWLENGKDGDQ